MSEDIRNDNKEQAIDSKRELVKVADDISKTYNINNLNLFNEKELAIAESLLLKFTRSEKSGIKTVNDGIAVLMRAKDLNLPFTPCIEHIHVINGKTGIDIHLIKALLLKAGVTWNTIKDYTPLYEYTDGINVYVENKIPEDAVKVKSAKDAEERFSKDDSKIYVYPVKYYQDMAGNVYKDYQLNGTNGKFTIVINKQQIAAATSAGKIPVFRIANQPIDYITEYEFTRTIHGKTITAKSRFSLIEAQQANLFIKDTYKYYARILIGHRAFTYGARDIASDVLFGVSETTELKLMNNVNLSKSDLSEIPTAEVVDD